MPRSMDVTFTCPCGASFSDTIYQAVNVTLDPRLLYRLLAGTLNVATCPNCGRKAESAQPFVYHDMRRGLFAYVSPRETVDQDEREALLAELRKVYVLAVQEAERVRRRRERGEELPRPTVRRTRPADELAAKIEPEAPPMQVIFGVGQLAALVDSLLEPEEKLGKVALSTRNADTAARERLRAVAGRIAEQAQCDIMAEEDSSAYIVWIYGPRARVNTLASALGTHA